MDLDTHVDAEGAAWHPEGNDEWGSYHEAQVDGSSLDTKVDADFTTSSIMIGDIDDQGGTAPAAGPKKRVSDPDPDNNKWGLNPGINSQWLKISTCSNMTRPSSFTADHT
jgi:hypothetical protein